MFNNYTHTNIDINSCSGGIYKTYPESFMIRFNLQSGLSKNLLCPKPRYNFGGNDVYSSEWEVVVILQMVICGDMEVLAEIITKKDFDKIINNISEKNELGDDENG